LKNYLNVKIEHLYINTNNSILRKNIMKLGDIVFLLRLHQWYKNLIIFLAIIFSGNFLNIDSIFLTFIGFIALVCISSSNYILNDLVDLEQDKLNPEKTKRPLCSGKINRSFAIFLFFILLIIGFVIAYFLDILFLYIAIGIFLISTLYSVYLKHMVFADIIAISSNFILRAVAGAVIINVFISSWLVMGVFFFAMFLVTGKRYGEISFLKENAINHRKVLNHYSKDLLFSLFNVFMALLIIIFALYSFSSEHRLIIWTTPLFVYIVLRYYYLILLNHSLVRNPEQAYHDKPLLIASILFTIAMLILIGVKS